MNDYEYFRTDHYQDTSSGAVLQMVSWPCFGFDGKLVCRHSNGFELLPI